MPEVTVQSGPWEAVGHLAALVRIPVFVDEQGVPRELEWDELDEECLHFVAITADGETVGTARLTPDRHVGRMAILHPWRGYGIGRLLLEAAIGAARERGDRELLLAAQLPALPFYERLGFQAYGPEFEDAGLMHRMMRRSLESV